MTRFFMPRLAQGDPAVERVYQQLREEAEACTGFASRPRRIQAIECRRGGVDRHLQVGEPDPGNSRTVEAILQLGRDTYTVHHAPSELETEHTLPTVLRRTEVYAVTDFE
jgi:hypothetical protein